jgi:hypothetical protein
MKLAGHILREYNLGYSPRELFWKLSWYEIAGLLYASDKNTSNKQVKEDGTIQETKHENGRIITVTKKKLDSFKRKL